MTAPEERPTGTQPLTLQKLPGAVFAYGTFFWQGVGSLFPWNAFINSSFYFHHRFCGTPYADNFESLFTSPFTVFQAVALAWLMRYGGAYELKDLIIWPLATYAMVFVIMAAFVVVRINVEFLFWCSMCLTCISGAMGAILQGGIFGLVAKFPAVYTGALMNGQALAGLLASFVGIVTTAVRSIPNTCAGPDATSTVVSCDIFHDDYSTMFFFGLTMLVMVTCIMSLLRLLNMPIAEMYIVELPSSTGSLEGLGGDSKYKERNEYNEIATSPRPTRSPKRVPKPMNKLTARDTAPVLSSSASTALSPGRFPVVDEFDFVDIEAAPISMTTDARPMPNPDLDSVRGPEVVTELTPLVSKSRAAQHAQPKIRRGLTHEDLLAHANVPASRGVVVDTLHIIGSPAAAVFINFAITIAMFPSIAVNMKSEYECIRMSRVFNDLFVPILLFLFNVGDLLGRSIAGKFSPDFIHPHNVWVFSAARIIFVPIFLMSNIRNNALPVLFKSDVCTVGNMIALGATNGFVASKAMMFGPTLVPKERAPVAGTIMVCLLTLGLMTGSFLSFLTQFAIHPQIH